MDCGRRSAVDDDRSCRMRLAVDDDRCQGRWAVDEARSRIAFYQAQSKESLDRIDKNLDRIRENLRAIRKMRMSSATIPRYSSSSLSSSAPRRRHQSLHSPTIVNDYPPLLLPLRWYDPPLELPLRWRDPPPFQHPPSPNSSRPHWQSPSEPSHPSSLSPPVRFRIPEPDIQPDPTAATPPLPPAQTELPPPLPLCPRNLALGVKPDLTRSDSGSASALSLDRPADLPVLQATRPSPPMTLYAPVTDAFHHPTHLPHPDPTSSDDDGFAPQTPVQTHPTIADGILQSSAHQQSRDTIPFDPMPDSLIHLQRAPPEAVEQDGHGDHGHGDCDLETHEVTSATIFDSVEATSAQLIGYFINYKDWIPLEIENRRKIIRLDKVCCGRTGEISSEIGKLENLDTILLQVNDLTRELPSELDQLQSLQSMDLPKNTFTGPVEIQLRKNTFTGSITQHLDTKGWLLFTSGPDDTKRLLNEGFLHLRRKVMHRSRFMRKSSILPSIVNRVKKDLIQNPLHIIFYVDVLSMTRSTLASLSKGFAELSTDRQFLQLRSKQVWSRRNTGFDDGFLQGTEAFAQGVAFGVTVVLTKPVENARQHGFLGLAHGIGRAFLGVVVQPLSGALDFVSLTVDGIGACCVKCLDIINNKAYSLQCSQDVRRNVNKGWDLKFELSDPAYGSKENGKLTFYGPTTTIEEQGIKELDMRPDGISSLLYFTDLKGRDKELVM